MKSRIVVVGLLGLALGIWGLPLVSAAEEHQHKEAAVSYTCPMHPEIQKNEPGKCPQCGMNLVKKEAKATIPETIAGIWAEVKEHEEELGKIIAGKKLAGVHEAAFALRDMVNALPDKSKDLPAEKLTKVKANAKFVADLANRLDESGDANDQVATEASFKKLQGILKTIEALYPPAALHEQASAHHEERKDGGAAEHPHH